MPKGLKKNKAVMPNFPELPKKDGGNSGEEETKVIDETQQQPATRLTKEQQIQLQTMQNIQQLQNTGIFRLNILQELQEQRSISTELGQALLERLDRIAAALEKLGEDNSQ